MGLRDFIAFAVSIGWFKTDMGTSYADLESIITARQVVEILNEAIPVDNGSFRQILSKLMRRISFGDFVQSEGLASV
jgi:hypothetical protein